MDELFYKDMGRRIAALRRAKGWTQEVMGQHMTITSSYLARIEIGVRRPTLEVLGQVAEVLGVPMWRLLTDARQTTDERAWKRQAKDLREAVDELSAKDLKLLTQLACRLRDAQTSH